MGASAFSVPGMSSSAMSTIRLAEALLFAMNLRPLSDVSRCLAAAYLPAHAISIPLDQLQPGLWKVERKIEKLDLNLVEYETRNTEYCASPRKEISAGAFDHQSVVQDRGQQGRRQPLQHTPPAACPASGGENTTVITIVSPTEYTAEVDTIGTKFGEKQHRKEVIRAVRAGDCQS